MSESRIPIYRRHVAPGISFATFSSEGTELIGELLVAEDKTMGPAEGRCDDTRIWWDETDCFLSADAALAYAKAGKKGLRFEASSPPYEVCDVTGAKKFPSHAAYLEFRNLPAQPAPFVKPEIAETRKAMYSALGWYDPVPTAHVALSNIIAGPNGIEADKPPSTRHDCLFKGGPWRDQINEMDDAVHAFDHGGGTYIRTSARTFTYRPSGPPLPPKAETWRDRAPLF